MSPPLRRLLQHPLGAAMPVLAVFLALLVILGRSVPETIVIFIVAALGLMILARPEWGIQLLILHMAVSFSQFFDIPRLGPLSLPLIIEGMLVMAFVIRLSLLRKPLYANFPENWFLGAYSFMVIMSLILTEHLTADNLNILRQSFVLVILIYFLATNLIDNRAGFMRMFAVLIISDLILLSSGLLNYAGFLQSSRVDLDKIQGRTTGIIINPNALAYTMIALLPFVICLIIYARRPVWKLLSMVIVAANLFVILNTLSRGGFLALVAVVLLFVFRLSRDRRLLALMILLAMVTYLILPAALFDRFEKVNNLQGTSRYVLTMIGLEMAAHNPIFGVGLGNFAYYFPKYDIFNRGGATAPHNLYTSIAAQTGIPSLIFYLMVLALAWRRLSKLLPLLKRNDERFLLLLVIALQANILNIVVFGLTSHVEHEPMLFISLAMVLILDRLVVSQGAVPGRVSDSVAGNASSGAGQEIA